MADVRLNRRAVNALLHGGGGPVYRDLVDRCQRLVNAAKRDCPVGESGHLRSSIRYAILRRTDGSPYGQVGSDLKYSLWVHEGTGIYGPNRRRIVPRRASVLRFKPRGSTKYVYARSVRGVRPRRFLTDNLGEATR